MTDDLVKRLRELNTFEWHARPATTKGICFEAADRIEKLEAGINALVNCQSALPRAALREAAADILDKRTWRTEDQSPLVSQNHALRFRIEKLEAALREITDCCTLPAENDFEMREIARKALEENNE